MTSDRVREAVAELDAYRLGSVATDPDLFTALESVLEHAGIGWKAEALEQIRRAATVHRELTIEDVDWPPTIDNRARGSVMVLAARNGWIKRLGYVPGGAGRHGRPIVLWASNLYRSDSAAQ